jgi:hypothetical protein
LKHLVIVDINQAQRDDLLNRLTNAVPNSDSLYRVILNCTETQRLTALRYFNAIPTEVPIIPVLPPVDVPPVTVDPTIPVLTDIVVPEHHHHREHRHLEVHLAGSDPEADPDES